MVTKKTLRSPARNFHAHPPPHALTRPHCPQLGRLSLAWSVALLHHTGRPPLRVRVQQNLDQSVGVQEQTLAIELWLQTDHVPHHDADHRHAQHEP